MTHQTEAVARAAAIKSLGTDPGALHEVPLTLRYHLSGDRRLQARKPLRISFPLNGGNVQAEVLYGRNGSCIFFRLELGGLPFTAQGDARQQVIDLIHALKRDADYLTSDITLLKNPATGAIAIRSSAVLQGKPGMVDLFNELIRFAQQARPYLEVLKPLLRH